MMTENMADGTVVEGSNQPDYSAVELPSKDRKEYSYVERRAELLQLIEEAGGPSMINQTEWAEKFGVSQQQISKDLDRLAVHVHERLVDRDRRAFAVGNVVERSVRGLLDEGEYRKAAKTMMEYDEWITEFHDLDRLYEQVEQLMDAGELDRQ